MVLAHCSVANPVIPPAGLPCWPAPRADIVRVLKDINLNVVSAEVDTIGRNAVDRFNLTYAGEPLPGECASCIHTAAARSALWGVPAWWLRGCAWTCLCAVSEVWRSSWAG